MGLEQSCGFLPGRGSAGTDDRDGHQPRMTLRTEVAGEVREHAVKQFVGVGRFDLHVPFLAAQLVEQIQALLHAPLRRRDQDLFGFPGLAGGGMGLERFAQVGQELAPELRPQHRDRQQVFLKDRFSGFSVGPRDLPARCEGCR